jgi:predicted methyltransferase
MVGMGTLLMAMAMAMVEDIMVEDIDHRIIDLQTDLINQDLSIL